jgi:hypothetical protein
MTIDAFVLLYFVVFNALELAPIPTQENQVYNLDHSLSFVAEQLFFQSFTTASLDSS